MNESGREASHAVTGQLGRAVRKLLFTFFLISVVSGRSGIFAAVCAGIPITVTMLCASHETPFVHRFLRGLMWSVLGSALGIVFMRLFGSYSLGAWLIPLLMGIAVCLLYELFSRHIPSKRHAISKSILLIGMLLLCFICG